MNQQPRSAARVAPLPREHAPELAEAFQIMERNLGFVPNSVLIMQRDPALVRGFAQLSGAVFSPGGKVDRRLKRLIAHVASRTAGCRYCMAHTAAGALHLGLDEQKLAAVWEYQTNPLFTPAERAALDFTVAASAVPNAVDDADFSALRAHWNETEIVEIVGVISLFGFLNRWNDTFGTPLEREPAAVGEKFLASHGWSVGKHV